MTGTINTVDIHSFCGHVLTRVELGEFDLKLYFTGDNQLNIEESWEYQDKNLKVLDRYYSAQLRKTFLLGELVNCTLEKHERIATGHYLWFSNTNVLVIYSEPSVDYSAEFLNAKQKEMNSMGGGWK